MKGSMAGKVPWTYPAITACQLSPLTNDILIVKIAIRGWALTFDLEIKPWILY